MKQCFTFSKSANRFNVYDWFVYQKSGSGVGSISWKALQRPLNEASDIVVPKMASSKSLVSSLSIWQRIKNFFLKIFKFLF